MSIGCVSLKIFFSRTTVPDMPIFTKKLIFIVKILNYKNRDPRTKTGAPDRVQSLTQDYKGKVFKNILKNYNATVCEITVQASLNCEDSELWTNIMVPEGIQIRHRNIWGTCLKIFFSRTTVQQFVRLLWKHPWLLQILNW